jgi:hypothetical protein
VCARRRPAGPERPVNPSARCTPTPFLFVPARALVPSSITTSGAGCPGPSVASVPASSAAVSASALCACPAVAVVPASCRDNSAARAKLTWVPSSARSTVSRSVRRFPDSPSMISSGANTRPQSRHPTFHNTNSTVPTAVCNFRFRVRLPLRTKSSRTPHRGHPNGATNPRTSTHRGPHTESINRSWASASVSSNARSGTSRDIATANDSNSIQDERASNTPGSIDSVRVVADTGRQLLRRVDDRLQSYKIRTEVQRSDTLPKFRYRLCGIGTIVRRSSNLTSTSTIHQPGGSQLSIEHWPLLCGFGGRAIISIPRQSANSER